MNFDIVVVGASSAGLFAAEILAKNGKKVALFEKSNLVDPDSRTYIITSGIYRVISDINPSLIRHKIEKIQLQSGEQQAEVLLRSPDLVLDRKELLITLRNRAEAAGVEIFIESEFLGFDINQGDSKLKIRHKDQEIWVRTPVLISADGVNSGVRSWIFSNKVPFAPLLQAEIDLPADWDESVTKVWFNVDATPYFYWLIPDQNRKAVVGLITKERDPIRQHLDDFLLKRKLKANSYQTGVAALHTPKIEVEACIGGIQVFFVGDAAGQVKVTTVGGTVTGLVGGRAAAEAILSGASYREKLKSVDRELDLHYFIRSLLDKMSAADYQNLIQFITPPVQKLLRSHDRDSMRAHFWKLPILQPRFIPLGLKLLLI